MTLTQEDKVILSGLKKLREDNNVKLGDLARELCMSQGQLSMHESGVRGFTNYDIDSFAEDYRSAVEKICYFNQEYEVDRDGLLWKRVTEDRLSEAVMLRNSGKNIVQISVELGVDENSLEKLLNQASV